VLARASVKFWMEEQQQQKICRQFNKTNFHASDIPSSSASRTENDMIKSM